MAVRSASHRARALAQLIARYRAEDDVRDFCRGKIAHFKVPRYVKIVDDFPMTVTGKVRKVEMRERSIAELGLEQITTA